MVATLLRETYLLTWSKASRTIPDKKKAAIVEVLKTGLLTFLFGFFVWNLDNIFCDPWTRIKRNVGWPLAFFMEGKVCEMWGGIAPLLTANMFYRSRVVACVYRKSELF